MPRRSNTFQRLMFLIHEKLAGEATVTESALLTDMRTSQQREVDVMIETVVADSSLRICIECRTGRRRATVKWVEEMIGKHNDLPTDKLILISESGFTSTAREKAKRNMVETVALEAALETDWTEIIHKFKTIYLGRFQFVMRQFSVAFEPPLRLAKGEIVGLDTPVFRASGQPVGTINSNVQSAFTGARGIIMEQVVPGNTTKIQVKCHPNEEAYIERDGNPHWIRCIEIETECMAEPRIPVDLRTAVFRDVQIAYGEVKTQNVEGVVGVLERRGDENRSVVTWCWEVKER